MGMPERTGPDNDASGAAPAIDLLGQPTGLSEPLQVRKTSARSRRLTPATQEFLMKRTAEALARQSEKEASVVLQKSLPFWTDENRGVPNPIIRSGLFAAQLPGSRGFTKGEVVASLGNYELAYTGEQLLQEDLSCWMSMLHLASTQRFGDAVFFTGYQLIKDMGWRIHSDSYTNAKASIERLKANSLTVRLADGTAGYSGSLIREFAWDATAPDGKVKWMVRFEPRILKIFEKELVSVIEWEQRKMIPIKNSLTRWLHAFYSSHAIPLPMRVLTIKKLCKSEEQRVRDFQVRLVRGLELLKKIGFLESYRVEDRQGAGQDIVHVVRAKKAAAVLLQHALSRRLPAAG